jgi:hypothetical protein
MILNVDRTETVVYHQRVTRIAHAMNAGRLPGDGYYRRQI